jgi:hypothetical protein
MHGKDSQGTVTVDLVVEEQHPALKTPSVGILGVLGLPSMNNIGHYNSKSRHCNSNSCGIHMQLMWDACGHVKDSQSTVIVDLANSSIAMPTSNNMN